MTASTDDQNQLHCKNLHSYLKTLPPTVLDKLYNHPATCLAVYRQLPALAQQYVMRFLYVEQPIPQAVVSSWVSTKHQSDHIYAAKTLADLRVWHQTSMPGGLPGWLLNVVFRQNFKMALLGSGTAWLGTGSLTADKHIKDVPFLDNYAKERWECILHFMVGSKEGADIVSRDVMEVLLHAGLMKCDTEQIPQITPSGFQFLLLDTPSQVWYFLLQYLGTLEKRGLDLVETLSFLFQLSFLTLGNYYSTEQMNESHLKFLQHLREIGLVYERKRKSQRFYPTRLAINLAAGLSSTKVDSDRQGYIVVETNYRIYAYTDSPLDVALLGLFCELLYRFPNLCVANLTRDSVRQALSCGIKAEQIIHFLRSHAHSEMLKKTPVMPPTISDQIRLWEMERDRFLFTDGVLYNQFLSQQDFELLRDYAKDLGVLEWENVRQRMMVVSRGGHEDVKRFWKRQKKDS